MPTISENLITDLHSPDEKTRRYAVEDLVDCGGDEALRFPRETGPAGQSCRHCQDVIGSLSDGK